jgi:uncharacterized membrane protein
MLPLSELRGGLIYAAACGIPFAQAFIICLVGNILPVPFLLLFLRKIFDFLEKYKRTARLVLKLEEKAKKVEAKIHRFELVGLFIWSAIPLPGTGAWTAVLVAVIFDIQIKRAFPAIALGTLTAGILMSVFSYLIPGLFF